jgi:hypothetical protein
MSVVSSALLRVDSCCGSSMPACIEAMVKPIHQDLGVHWESNAQFPPDLWLRPRSPP